MRLIIFDWDDTFLPTAVLRTLSGCQRDSSLLDIQTDIYTDAFALIQAVCERTISCALSLGRVILVTNGSTTWIQMSCQEYLPHLWPILKSIPKYSAKDLIDDADQKHPSVWKIEAFRLILGKLLADERALVQLNYSSVQGGALITLPEPDVVVSIGDSLHERDALFLYHQLEADLVIRSIKFVPLPDCDRLVLQHRALQHHLPQVMKFSNSIPKLDLRYFFQAYPTKQQTIDDILISDDYDSLQRGASDQWSFDQSRGDINSFAPNDNNSDLFTFDESVLETDYINPFSMTDDDTATSRHQTGGHFVAQALGKQVFPLSSGNPFLVLINEKTV